MRLERVDKAKRAAERAAAKAADLKRLELSAADKSLAAWCDLTRRPNFPPRLWSLTAFRWRAQYLPTEPRCSANSDWTWPHRNPRADAIEALETLKTNWYSALGCCWQLEGIFMLEEQKTYGVTGLVAALAERGVELIIRTDRVILRQEGDAPWDDLRPEIKRRRDALYRWALARTATYEVSSRVRRRKITIGPNCDYTLDEIAYLAGATPAQLRLVDAVKRTFGGRILPPDIPGIWSNAQ
jgi:hypothetical protein